VRGKAKQHNLIDAQKDDLKEREATERAAAESALLKLYTEGCRASPTAGSASSS
jgi:hypothetical protein